MPWDRKGELRGYRRLSAGRKESFAGTNGTRRPHKSPLESLKTTHRLRLDSIDNPGRYYKIRSTQAGYAARRPRGEKDPGEKSIVS